LEDAFPLLVIFTFITVIVWLRLHYKERQRREGAQLASAANASNAELAMAAEKMERRIDALEQILDAEAPGWRKKHHEHT
jgi:phage shock protein B